METLPLSTDELCHGTWAKALAEHAAATRPERARHPLLAALCAACVAVWVYDVALAAVAMASALPRL